MMEEKNREREREIEEYVARERLMVVGLSVAGCCWRRCVS